MVQAIKHLELFVELLIVLCRAAADGEEVHGQLVRGTVLEFGGLLLLRCERAVIGLDDTELLLVDHGIVDAFEGDQGAILVVGLLCLIKLEPPTQEDVLRTWVLLLHSEVLYDISALGFAADLDHWWPERHILLAESDVPGRLKRALEVLIGWLYCFLVKFADL